MVKGAGSIGSVMGGWQVSSSLQWRLVKDSTQAHRTLMVVGNVTYNIVVFRSSRHCVKLGGNMDKCLGVGW